MPRYRWQVEFDANDDKDMEEQIREALAAFHSYYEDNVEELDEADE